MVEPTIFQAFSEWVSQNFLASAIAGGIVWDTIKLNLYTPFKNKLGEYFKSEEESEKYFETINNSKSVNTKKPYRDIEDIYEEVTGNSIPDKFIEELKEFLIANKDKIEMLNQEKGDFTSLNQRAERDINNVKGSQTIINFGG